MSDIQTFITQLNSGDIADAKVTMNTLLSTRAMEALESRKQEIAKTMYNGVEVPQIEEPVNQTEEWWNH